MGDIPGHKLDDIMTPITYVNQKFINTFDLSTQIIMPALGNNEGDGNYNFSFELNSSHLQKLYTEGLYD